MLRSHKRVLLILWLVDAFANSHYNSPMTLEGLEQEYWRSPALQATRWQQGIHSS